MSRQYKYLSNPPPPPKKKNKKKNNSIPNSSPNGNQTADKS